MLGANLLESLFVLSFNHQNPQLGLIALTGGTGSRTTAAQVGEPDTRQLTAPQSTNALLPRTLREEAADAHAEVGPNLAHPPPQHG